MDKGFKISIFGAIVEYILGLYLRREHLKDSNLIGSKHLIWQFVSGLSSTAKREVHVCTTTWHCMRLKTPVK